MITISKTPDWKIRQCSCNLHWVSITPLKLLISSNFYELKMFNAISAVFCLIYELAITIFLCSQKNKGWMSITRSGRKLDGAHLRCWSLDLCCVSQVIDLQPTRCLLSSQNGRLNRWRKVRYIAPHPFSRLSCCCKWEPAFRRTDILSRCQLLIHLMLLKQGYTS